VGPRAGLDICYLILLGLSIFYSYKTYWDTRCRWEDNIKRDLRREDVH
jgi:hypothetical protein